VHPLLGHAAEEVLAFGLEVGEPHFDPVGDGVGEGPHVLAQVGSPAGLGGGWYGYAQACLQPRPGAAVVLAQAHEQALPFFQGLEGVL
jgi:hypothetical protein